MILKYCSFLYYIVLRYAHDIYIIVIFVSTMVSFGSVSPNRNKNDGVSNPEPLSQPILDAMSQVVIMAMEKHTYGHEKKKKKLNLFYLIFLSLPLAVER